MLTDKKTKETREAQPNTPKTQTNVSTNAMFEKRFTNIFTRMMNGIRFYYRANDPVILPNFFSKKPWVRAWGFSLLMLLEYWVILAIILIFLTTIGAINLENYPFVENFILIVIITAIFVIFSSFWGGIWHWIIISELNIFVICLWLLFEATRFFLKITNIWDSAEIYFPSTIDLTIFIPFFWALAASLYVFILNRKKIFRIQYDINKFILKKDGKNIDKKRSVFSIGIINESRETRVIERILLVINDNDIIEIFNSEENSLVISPKQFYAINFRGIIFEKLIGKNITTNNDMAGRDMVFYFKEKERIKFSFITLKISGKYYYSVGVIPHDNQFTKILFSGMPYDKKITDALEKHILIPIWREIKKNDIVLDLPLKQNPNINDSGEMFLPLRSYIQTKWVLQPDLPKDIKLVCSTWPELKKYIAHSLF